MRFHFALAAVAVLGCSSSYRDTTDSVELSLSRKGGQLLLQGTQLDPSYVGRYVNPRAIEQMTVRLTKSGELVGVCRDEVGESDCGNVPFYSAIRTDGERRLIEAWDIHGTLVARLGCTDSEFCAPITPGECGSDDVSACSSTGGGGTDTTNDNETPAGGGGWEDFFSWATGGGGGSGGSGTTGTPGEDGSSSSSWTDGWTDSGSTGTDGTDGSTGTTNWGTREEDEFIGTPTGCTAPPKTDDCGVIKEWAQDCFCDLVNRRLESFKVGTQIDCSQLGIRRDFPCVHNSAILCPRIRI